MTRPTARSFPIRSVTTLSLFAATAACGDKDGDSIVGDWGLRSVTASDGYSSTLPYTVSKSGGEGYSYSYTFGIQLRADSETSATWCYYYEYTYNGTTSSDEYCETNVTMSREGSRYDIRIGSGGDGFTMTCEPDVATMSCDALIDGDSYALDFDRL